MIIGFLGKGGSGKSTLSTHMVHFLAEQKKSVLAIDADYNMDLAYNLYPKLPDAMNYIGRALQETLQHVGIQTTKELSLSSSDKPFSLYPLDKITEKYSLAISPSVRLMVSGPQTDDILYDVTCSHSLSTPLKVYLPLLSLSTHEFVVLDEKAGADGVSTGVAAGFDLAVIVTEPTIHGLKTAKQIAIMLEFFGTPYIYALNKIKNREIDEALFFEKLSNFPDVYFNFSMEPGEADQENFRIILEKAQSLSTDRLERSKNRIEKSIAYKTKK